MEDDKPFQFNNSNEISANKMEMSEGAINPHFTDRNNFQNDYMYQREVEENDLKTQQLQKDIDGKLLPSEIRDQARYGGNYTKIKQINQSPYSEFNLLVNGHIESGQISDYDGVCIKFDFLHGTDWKIIDVSFLL